MTGRACPAIHMGAELEVPRAPIGRLEIPQGASACRNGLGQNRADGRMQALGAQRSNTSGLRGGPNAG